MHLHEIEELIEIHDEIGGSPRKKLKDFILTALDNGAFGVNWSKRIQTDIRRRLGDRKAGTKKRGEDSGSNGV